MIVALHLAQYSGRLALPMHCLRNPAVANKAKGPQSDEFLEFVVPCSAPLLCDEVKGPCIERQAFNGAWPHF